MGRSSDPHRRRMPWMAEKECVPGVVHSSKEKMVLDGAQRVDVDCVDRASQVYPLEALRVTVAACEYNTSTGRTFLKRSLRRNPMYSGNGFTTRSGRRGRTTRTPPAPPFISFATAVAQPAPYALRIFRGEMHCSVCRHCSPSPSVGADSLVDARFCRLRAHPLIDAADTPAHCWCFLHDCCTAPSSWWNGTGEENMTDQVQSVGAGSPVNVPPTKATHTTSEHRNRRDREGIDGVSGHQFSFHIICRETTVGISNNTIHQQ
ncbi:hypothetical protein TcBrA4_0022370 [Trypanosoma cruzi]|nr:hypothetical protein TcBrA4_0022370 [Trypanosoma cruzi]